MAEAFRGSEVKVRFLTWVSLILISQVSHQINAEQLKLAKIKIKNTIVSVEIADSPEKRAKGLMHRTSVDPKSGMLFVFENEQALGFWMRNTLIPLSIGFFNKKRELLNILEMVPASDLDMNPIHYNSDGPALYALEMNKGWYSKHQITVGDRFEVLSFADSKLLQRARP